MCHPIESGVQLDQKVYRLDLDGLQGETVCKAEAWIYLPNNFVGTDISLVFWGYRSDTFKKANPSIRYIFTCGWKIDVGGIRRTKVPLA
jgi:hypothetical protein